MLEPDSCHGPWVLFCLNKDLPFQKSPAAAASISCESLKLPPNGLTTPTLGQETDDKPSDSSCELKLCKQDFVRYILMQVAIKSSKLMTFIFMIEEKLMALPPVNVLTVSALC